MKSKACRLYQIFQLCSHSVDRAGGGLGTDSGEGIGMWDGWKGTGTCLPVAAAAAIFFA